MKKTRAVSDTNSLYCFKPTLFIFIFLLFFSFANGQGKRSNAEQWRSVGGEIVASGTHDFTNFWYGAGNGLWWKNDEERNIPATHTGDEVNQDINIEKGQFTVQGPGFIAKFQRRIKSIAVGSGLKFAETGNDFWPATIGGQDMLRGNNGWTWYDNNIIDFDPAVNNGGWVPANKELTIDVFAVNLPSGIGYTQYGAPAGIEYEYWFFPREGGQIISKGDINKTDDNKFDDSGEIVGKVTSGSVFDETLNKWLKPGDDIRMGHIYQTRANENANINLFENSANITLTKDTKIKVKNKIAKKQSGGVQLYAGRLWSLFKSKKSKYGYAVETFNSVVAVEGTSFETAYDANTGETKISVFEGVVSFECKTSDAAPLKVSAGITASFDSNCSPNLMATDPSLNTPAKAGWNTSMPSNTVSSIPISAEGGLVPIADSHVYAYSYSGWSKANWGKYEQLGAGWNPTGGEKRAFLKFDLSNVDPNSFEKATLKLYHNHTGGGNNAELGVYAVEGPWNEGRGTYKPASVALPGELAWNNQPKIARYPTVYFNPGQGINKWVEVDVTTLVKAWLTPGFPNYGMVIKAGENSIGGSESQYSFCSREAKDASKRPQLIINGAGIQNSNQNSDISEIVGDWDWFTNFIVSFFPDGTLSSSGGSGKWKKNEKGATYNYIINWDNGYVDKLNLAGQTLKGVNQNGTTVSGKRIETNIINQNSGIPDIAGDWEITINDGNIYQYNLKIVQYENGFYGDMIRSNGNEANSKVEGTISQDGSIKFTRSRGNWKQYYVGSVVNQSGGKTIQLEGTNGTQETRGFTWIAQYKTATSANISVAGSWNVNQYNGHKGTLDFQQNQSGQLNGKASWDRHPSGIISGRLSGNSIEFTISYPNNIQGIYSGTVTQNGFKIIDGTVKASDGRTNSGWDASKAAAVSSIAGEWNTKQSNGYNGKLSITQDQTGKITGNVIWNGYLKGTVSGQASGNAIEFTISYPGGDKGFYKGTLTDNGTRIVNGTAKGNNGVLATWEASR